VSNTLIRAAFETRLKTWADAQIPPIPIAFENVPFTQPTTRYLRSYLLPLNTKSDTLDQVHRGYAGVYQVSVVMPLNDGPGNGEVIAKALDTLFPMTTPMTQGGLKVTMTTPMSAAKAMPDTTNYVIPVSCRYRADTY